MAFKQKSLALIAGFVFLAFSFGFGSSVAVHDPSILIVYKDEAGNSYPENSAAGDRTKYYYIFGTQNGAAYSKDMINWTAFTPTFSVGGTVTESFYEAFKEAADWSGHTTSDDTKGNMWAPDIIWNKKLQKWCLYTSVNGDDWMSSIVLHTADKVEGPYEYVGTVVYGGMDNESAGKAGNLDYEKVTGSSTIDSRYYQSNTGVDLGQYDGGYGVSCIDPNVFYDEDGNLWLLYGSWSGGIFLLRLDESTGLRDYSYSYGTSPVWSGTRLKQDPYMGIHVAGGYYVSGEGPYIQYFKDKSGNGYYYLFISYGFYSPEGGYTMRVFRSATLDGDFVDVSGDLAIFDKYILNYGSNTTYGFPIIQNYKWDAWAEGYGEVADGHNSLLSDEDGSMYLIYHRKMDNGTAWHNVEVHQLYFNDMGWLVAAPFEYRKGYGLPSKKLSPIDIVGDYRIIIHDPTDYENLVTNQEQDLHLHGDGTVTGTYTGTWTYNYDGGSHYLNIDVGSTVFSGVALLQLQNDVSEQTTTFTAMNSSGDRALWGFKVPKTEVVTETQFLGDTLIVGNKDYSTAWDDYDNFYKVSASGDFVAEFDFTNNTEAAENWNNWVLVFKNTSGMWYLRSDSYSLETFSGMTVGYSGVWSDWDEFKQMFKNSAVKLKALRTGETMEVFALVGDSVVYSVSGKGTPTDDLEIYLGVDNAWLNVSRSAVGTLGSRSIVGTIDDGGVYNAVFNTEKGDSYSVSGDFNLKFKFYNYGNREGANNWDNYIVASTATEGTMLLRADAYALDATGTATFEYNWSWDDFTSIMANAYIEMDINRVDSTLTYDAIITAESGETYSYKTTVNNAPLGDMSFAFTCEKSAVDLISVAAYSTVGTANSTEENVEETEGDVTTPIGNVQLASINGYVQNNSLHFNITEGQNIKIQVYDMLGHKVYSSNRNWSAGSHEISFDKGANKLSKGNYFVRMGSKNLNLKIR